MSFSKIVLFDKPRHEERSRTNKDVCCFSHIIGPFRKRRSEKPMFDYERSLYDVLMKPGYMNGDARPSSSC